jgi:hypothetical protein
MSPTTPNYHRDATALLPTSPRFSGTAAEVLDRRERELGIQFPDAIREWYLLEGAVDLLRQHSNADKPLPIDRLGEPFSNWYGCGSRDFVAQGLVVFMHENQGVCNWAFKLDGSPDPEVVVEVDTAPNDEWLPCADKFSTFIYCQVWDYRHVLDIENDGVGVSAQEPGLAQSDLQFLQANFLQRPTTCCWPGNAKPLRGPGQRHRDLGRKESSRLVRIREDACVPSCPSVADLALRESLRNALRYDARGPGCLAGLASHRYRAARR